MGDGSDNGDLIGGGGGGADDCRVKSDEFFVFRHLFISIICRSLAACGCPVVGGMRLVPTVAPKGDQMRLAQKGRHRTQRTGRWLRGQIRGASARWPCYACSALPHGPTVLVQAGPIPSCLACPRSIAVLHVARCWSSNHDYHLPIRALECMHGGGRRHRRFRPKTASGLE